MPNQTGSMLCPACRKLISVDEPRCPYCGALRPGLWGWGPVLQRLFGARLELVPVISAVCVLLFLISMALDLRGARPAGFLPLPSPSGPALYLLGMTGVERSLSQWWTLFTAIYLHGSIIHIFFNYMWIRQLGGFAEDELGAARFFILFSLSGVGGFIFTNIFGSAASVGASGSIFGLLGAMIAFRRRRGAGSDMVSQQFVTWAVVLFVFGLLVPFVDNWAHLGGFATGYLLGTRFHGRTERPESRGVQLGALLLLALTVFSFVISVVSRWPYFTQALQTRGL